MSITRDYTKTTRKQIEDFFKKAKTDFSHSNMAHKGGLDEIEAIEKYVYYLRAVIDSKDGFVRQAMRSMKAALR